MIAAKLALAVLVFSKTAAYRHESIPEGARALEELGRELGWKVTRPRSAIFSTRPRGLDAVVFLGRRETFSTPSRHIRALH
jgi:hypothetical protein